MASFNLLAATHSCAFSKFLLPPRLLSLGSPGSGRVSRTVRCMTATFSKPGEQTIVRKSANYKPPIWEHDYIQSLTSNYAGDTYAGRAAMLKEDVRIMLEKTEEPLDKLELIDAVQRLGVSYHFENEIDKILESMYTNSDWCQQGDLYSTALKFRLLRQRGYNVPQEAFANFVDNSGNFKESFCEDTKGLLSLYEASYLLMGGESVLERARDFTAKHLKEYLEKGTDPNLAMLVSHALELPLHWTMPRMEARWFIDAYEKMLDMNTKLVEFAKLDFNMVQAIHQEDLKHVSRWDVNAVEQFPDYMKICFLGFYNWVNEMAYDTLKEHGVHILPYLKRKWQDLCHCHIKEAKWANSGYIPTLDEYVNHGWTSVAAPLMLTHAFFLSKNPKTNPITKEELESLEKYHDILKWPSLVVRLADDLGTSWDEVKRGDTQKSVQVYMHETGASAEDAAEHIKYLIGEAWNKINEVRLMSTSPFNRSFVEIATNLARVSQYMYQYGDGHGHDIGGKNKDRVTLLLIEPIPLL